MDFSTIKLFPDNLVNAIGNTLLHSIWQGLVLAAITGLIIMCTRRSSSARRYNLLIGAMVLFAAAVAVTFVVEFSRPAVRADKSMVYQITTVKMQQDNYAAAAPLQLKFTDQIIHFLNNNANTIVLIWFMIVCARCLQLATGLNGLYHLRRRSIYPIDKLWENRVQHLASALGIRRMVGIAESGLAKVPMVIGHLKPLILIPIGLMTALSSEEIEAILVHELAHIRRRDYLVNLLQSLMEIVFFFNPAVLWVSALLKTERENCCDDIAVAHSSSKVNYIKALISCQEYRTAAPAYAMALGGKKGHLVARVKRILSNNNQSLNRLEKSLLAVCLVTAGLFTAAFTNAEKINKLVATAKKVVTNQTARRSKNLPGDSTSLEKTKNPSNDSTQHATAIKTTATTTKTDTIKSPALKIINPNNYGNGTCMVMKEDPYTIYFSKENGTFYQINYLEKVLVSMQVNGETVSASKVAQYQPQIDKILSKFKAIKEPAEPSEPREPAEPARPDRASSAFNQADSIVVNPKKAAKLEKSNAKLNRSLGNLGYQQSHLNYLKDAAIADSVHHVYRKTGVSYIVGPEVAKVARPAIPARPADPATPVGYKWDDASRRKSAIDDMLTEGIIASKDDLSFKLSTDEFIVNGKKQPQDVFLKYRAKYVKMTGHNEWTWYYNYDTSARSERSSVTDETKN